jgi:RNase P/RNase MRP subunit POP5
VVKLERQRYILIDYLAEGPVEEKLILGALWHTFTRLFGEVNAGGVGLYVISHDVDARRLILRCAHSQRDNVITATTLTRKISGKRVAFCTRLTSGTLLSLKRKTRALDHLIK